MCLNIKIKKMQVKELIGISSHSHLITNFNYFKELRLMLVTHSYIVKDNSLSI